MAVRRRGYFIFSFIMSLCFVCSFTGQQLAQGGNILWTVAYVVRLALLSILCGTVCGIVIVEWLLWWERHGKQLVYGKEQIVRESGRKSFKCSFVCSFLLIFFVWLLVYFAYYPGICSYDFSIQSSQFVSHDYNEHHPLAHTLLMEGFYRLGIALGDANIGIGIYVLFQMGILAMAIAFGIAFVKGKNRVP